jgi:hypothetical protein
MLVRPQSRLHPALSAILVSAIVGLAPCAVSADPLDEASCQRLRTEQQALIVLGTDKTVEKGASWAKERLTVADLNLVKRYLDVMEQIKFRCEKIVALAEPEEKDDEDDDDAASGAVPPLPERKNLQAAKSPAPQAVQPAKPSTAPVTPPMVKPNSAGKGDKATFGAASTMQMAPARPAPAR